MKTLRTPDARFENLPGYAFAPHYTEVDDGDGGTLRIHHVDEGPADGPLVLCMHGQPTWSYLYRLMIPRLIDAGLRVVAPDLVGFGRSDKPAAREDYSYQRQVDWMTRWLVQNDLRDTTFVGQDWGGLIGLRMVAENPERFARVVIANTGIPVPQNVTEERVAAVERFRREAPTPSLPEVMAAIGKGNPEAPEAAFAYWQKWCWDTEDIPVSAPIVGSLDGRQATPEEIAAYEAPFPDPSYKMGPRAMPTQVPTLPNDPSVPANQRAWEVFSKWEKPFLCCFSDNDPVSQGGEQPFLSRVPTAKNQPIQGGGHFLQEGRADEFAQRIIDFVAAS
ncbi:MAG: haloalkane dehalogenase [Myxococcota bacterium]